MVTFHTDKTKDNTFNEPKLYMYVASIMIMLNKDIL